MVAHRHDQKLGGEGLARIPRGAEFLATTTFRAGIQVKACLPRQVGGTARTQNGVLGKVFELFFAGHRHAVDQHVVGGTKRLCAVIVTTRIQVDDRNETVPCNAHRRLHADDHHPEHRRHDLDGRNYFDRVCKTG